MKTINTDSRVQLYYQLYDIILDKINSGEYKESDILPTENDLIKQYNISRITVRKAMDMLENEGFITKKRGLGTFVNSRKIEHNLTSIVHFNENMREYGYNSKTIMVCDKVEQANKTIADSLRIEEGQEIVRIDRLRFAENEPMCLESANFAYKTCPKLLGIDFSAISLRKFLEDEYGIVWKYARQNIRAVNATSEMASLLGIEKDKALLYIERVSYSKDDKPLEYLKAYYRSDIYHLTATLDVCKK